MVCNSRFYTCVSMSLTAFLLGCGESPPEDSDFDQSQIYEESYDDNADRLDHDYSSGMNGWRKGTLKVDFLLKQSSVYSEKVKHENTQELKNQTDITWAYTLRASFTQEVEVVEDLSILMPEGSEELRYEFFTSSPYYEASEDANADVSGEMSYELDYQVRSPNDVDYVAIDKKLSRKAVIEFLEIDEMEPSLYGKGYQFDLKIGFDYQQTGKSIFTRKNGAVTEMDEGLQEESEFNFTFYPTPNSTGLNDYPYLYEYKDLNHPETIDAVRKNELSKLSRLQNIANKDVEFISEEHVGAVTHQTKDKIVIDYKFEGNKLLPFIPQLESLAATPDSNLLTVTVTLEAN